MKKRIISVLLVAVMVMGLTACGSSSKKTTEETTAAAAAAETTAVATTEASGDGKIVIGLTLMDYGFTFFQDMLAMAKYTAAQEGVTIVDVDAAGDVQKQLTAVEDLIYAKKVDALLLNPVDSAAIAPATLQANKEGIPVVTVDVRSAEGEVQAHVASNNLDIGREAGKYAIEVLTKKYGSPKGKVFVMGYSQITSIDDRAKGFLEVVSKYPEIEVIQEDPISLNITESNNLWEDKMQTYSEGTLDIVYGANSTNASGILTASQAANRTDFSIIGVDDDEMLLNALSDDKSNFVATVVQSSTEMGRIGIEQCIAAAKGEKVEDVDTPLQVVTKDTVENYKAKIAEVYAKIKDYR